MQIEQITNVVADPVIDPGDEPSPACQSVSNYCGRLPEVAAILGHSEPGHRLINALARAHYRRLSAVTPALLTRITDQQLRELHHVGPGLVTWFRRRMDRIGMPQYDQDRDNDDKVFPVWLSVPQWLALLRLLDGVHAAPRARVLPVLAGTEAEIIQQLEEWFE